MSFLASEDGIVQLIRQRGATLEAGDILGILDPSRVKHAQPFLSQLPNLGPPQIVGTLALVIVFFGTHICISASGWLSGWLWEVREGMKQASKHSRAG